MTWNKDMSAAPRDGTHVLVAVYMSGMKAPIAGQAYYRDQDEDHLDPSAWWWSGEGPGDYYASPISVEPYAWMPLPDPPTP